MAAFIGMTLLNAISLQMFQKKMNISKSILPVSLEEHLQTLQKICFIYNNERISDDDIYNEGVMGQYAKWIVSRNI